MKHRAKVLTSLTLAAAMVASALPVPVLAASDTSGIDIVSETEAPVIEIQDGETEGEIVITEPDMTEPPTEDEIEVEAPKFGATLSLGSDDGIVMTPVTEGEETQAASSTGTVGDTKTLHVDAFNQETTDADLRLYFWDDEVEVPENPTDYAFANPADLIQLEGLTEESQVSIPVDTGEETVDVTADLVFEYAEDEETVTATYLSMELPADSEYAFDVVVSMDMPSVVTVVPEIVFEEDATSYAAWQLTWNEAEISVEPPVDDVEEDSSEDSIVIEKPENGSDITVEDPTFDVVLSVASKDVAVDSSDDEGDTTDNSVRIGTVGDVQALHVEAFNQDDVDRELRLYFWDYSEILPEDRTEWFDELTDACEHTTVAELQDRKDCTVDLTQGDATIQRNVSWVSETDEKDQLTAAYLSVEIPAGTVLDTVFHIHSDTVEVVTIVPVFDAESEAPFFGDTTTAIWGQAEDADAIVLGDEEAKEESEDAISVNEDDSEVETFTIDLSRSVGVTPFSFDNPDVVTVNNERYDYFSWSTTNPGTASCPGLGTGMKYIVGDDGNVDGRGMWRYVYCLDFDKSSPTGMQAGYTDDFTNREVAYALYYGAVYYYNTCRYAPYSTGDWRMDYWVTQMAVHILNDEFTLGALWNSLNQPGSSATQADKNLAYDRVSKIVNDANNPSNYGGFTRDGWLDMATGSFSLSGYQNTWSKSDGTWYSGGNFHANFSSYYGFDYREQITEYTPTVSAGASISKSDTKTYSDFRVAISDAQYKAWQATGKTIDVNVTMKIPRYWGGGVYASDNPDIQPVAFLTWSSAGGTATYSDSAQLTIKQVPQDGYLTLKKSSGNTGITNGNSNYSLADAVYTVYKTNNNGNLSNSQGTLTTKADGTTNKLKLTQGTYYVRETTAPKGYQKDDTIYTVKITTGHTSSSPYTLKVSDTPQTGNLKITKKSSNPGISDGNDCYSLNGAEFTIYKNSACTQVYKTITTNASGVATCNNMPLGQYWVKETKAPTGFERNTDFLEKITITANHTTSKPLSLTCSDVPMNDPVIIRIDKTPTGEVTGTMPSLAGAQFTIRYYDGYYKKNNLPSAPTRTWVIETQERRAGNQVAYAAYLTDQYLVDSLSDSLYYDGGQVVLPLGTITIQETKAPAGFTLNGYLEDTDGNRVASNGGVYVAQVTSDMGVSLKGGNEFIQREEPKPSNIIIKKYNGSNQPQSGTTYELRNSKGQVVGTATTGSDGIAKFRDLYPDTYTLTEIDTASGLTLLTKTITIKAPMTLTEQEVIDNGIDKGKCVYDPVENCYYVFDQTYEITNDVTLKLPLTGATTTFATFLPLIGGTAVFAGSAAIFFKKKRK